MLVTKTGMTPEYSAPETFRGLFLEESDYYSFGITLYELFCGKTPYKNMSPDEIARFTSIQRIPFPADMPQELIKLILGLTYYDITNRNDPSNPNRRWTFNEVDNWLKGIEQPIPGESKSQAADTIPAYTFLKKKYYDTQSLTDALAVNWKDGSGYLNSDDSVYSKEIENTPFTTTNNKKVALSIALQKAMILRALNEA